MVHTIACVVALVAKSLFIIPHEVAVPAEEVTRAVDRRCLVEMTDDEVIISCPSTRSQIATDVRQSLQAQYSLDVLFLLCGL